MKLKNRRFEKQIHGNIDSQKINTNSIVLEYDNYIDFPEAKPKLSIPAGIYYPSIHDKTDRFILLKANPDFYFDRDLDFDLASLGILDSLITINPEKVNNGNDVGKHGNDDGYFPMQEYHGGLNKVESSLQQFLKSREFYLNNNLGYKRSVLLFGQPGTGKSRYIENFCKRMIIEKNAVVIRIEQPFTLLALLRKGIQMLTSCLKDRLVIVVIEELAALVETNNTTELLSLLDHSLLRDGYIFLMTTNNPELIPSNIVDRPSRVDVLMNVDSGDFNDEFIERFYEHITGKEFPEEWKQEPFYTQKLSPAYLKELFVSMIINGTNMQASWETIEKRRRLVKNNFKKTRQVGFGV